MTTLFRRLLLTGAALAAMALPAASQTPKILRVIRIISSGSIEGRPIAL